MLDQQRRSAVNGVHAASVRRSGVVCRNLESGASRSEVKSSGYDLDLIGEDDDPRLVAGEHRRARRLGGGRSARRRFGFMRVRSRDMIA